MNIVTKPPKARSVRERISFSMDADMTVRVNNLAFNARSLDPLSLLTFAGVRKQTRMKYWQAVIYW